MKPMSANKLTKKQKEVELKSIMIMEEKHMGEIKAIIVWMIESKQAIFFKKRQCL